MMSAEPMTTAPSMPSGAPTPQGMAPGLRLKGR
jgi:hypothetical protein